MNIDIHTLAIVLSLTNLLQVIALYVQFLSDRTHRGLGWWTLGNALVAIGFATNYLRDFPGIGLLAIIANNVLFVSGLWLIYVGVLRFLDQREQRSQIIGFCTVFTIAIIYFTLINDNLAARRVLVSLSVSAISFLIAKALLIHKHRSVASSTSLLALTFLAHSAFFAMRALTPFMGAAVGGAFSPTLTQIETYLLVLIASTLWTFGFIILVNQRLNAENREAKENSDLIFSTSPDAVLITRLADGIFVNMNDGFTTLTGFTRAEVIGKSILEVNIWKEPADRQKLVTILNEKGSCENLQAAFLRKNGSQLIGLVSAKIIVLQGVHHIISVTHDITLRQRTEEEKANALVRLRTLSAAIEQSPITTVIIDLAGKIVFVNPKFTEITGYSSDEAIGQNSEILETEFTPSTENMELWDTIISGKNWHGIFQNKKKNGELYWESATISPVRDEHGTVTHFLALKEDITDRKRAEEALRMSEMKHRLLTEFTADVVWVLNLSIGKFTYISPSVFLLRGVTAEEAMLETLEDSLTPESITVVKQAIENNIKDFYEHPEIPKYYINEVQQYRKDGEIIWIEVSTQYRYSPTGDIEIVGVSRNIQERKNSENALRASEEKFKTMIETSPDGMAITTLDGIIQFVTAKVVSMWGYDLADELIGRNTMEFVHPSYHEKAIYLITEMINGNLTGAAEYLMVRKDGSLFYAEANANILRDAQNNPFGVLYIERDITERKQVEVALKDNAAELESINCQLEESLNKANEMAAQALHAEEIIRESEARYRAVFDTANDAIVSADIDGNIIDWNPGAERIFGYSKIEVVRQAITLLFPERYHANHLSGMQRVLLGGEKHVIGKTVEMEGLRNEGSEFPLEISLSEWQMADQKFFTAVIRDITERKRLKEELQQQATIDSLTGIINRRYFQQLALDELKRTKRLNRSLAIVIIDIDHFKHVNDTFGHAAGDQALLAFTKICRKNIRDIDLFARFGGDEFAMVLPETSDELAYMVVERIRLAVEAQPVDLDGKFVSLTISSGIANLSDGQEALDKLLSQADQALYRAKEAGRNKVVSYTGE